MKKIPVIAIVGPTASGKTDLSVKVAKYVNGEIISADSMQVYKEMSIASAAPTDEEKCGIKHHLFEFLSPIERFTVADYVDLAHKCINEVVARGKTPVIVGGTGLYVDSLLNNIKFNEESPEITETVRNELMAQFDLLGGEKMLEMLAKIDPDTANKLHSNDKKRIVRALEVYKIHNKTQTELNKDSKKHSSPYEVLYIGIMYSNRDLLYERINKRVDLMVENGILEEAKKTYERSIDSPYYSTAFQALGHKEFYDYFNGHSSLEECIESLKRSTRRYAKRQMTWFNKNENIHWIKADETESVFEDAKKIIDSNNK